MSVVKKSRCPKCQSTDREAYHNVRELAIDSVTPDGERYNRVIWRRTRCKNCGQVRIDKSFELVGKRKSNSPDSGKLTLPKKTSKPTITPSSTKRPPTKTGE